jgi:hypothetical protein
VNTLTTIPIRQITMYGIRVISLISGSLMPPFRLVALMLIQSLNGPAVNNPIKLPPKKAKLMNPTEAGEKLYGGAAKTWDWVRLRDRRQFAEKPNDREAQRMIGKAKI